MKIKKALFLFLALLLPVFIFLFLKFFGKNEFAVQPLYINEMPDAQQGCEPVSLPYKVPGTILQQLKFSNDTLCLIWFGRLSEDGIKYRTKVMEKYATDPISTISLDSGSAPHWAKCVFFLKPPYDLVLVDKKGLIRGQYIASNREQIDRLKLEIDIILKKY